MFSFYGGKPGNSFVIVKSFPSIGNTTDDTEANNLSMAKNFSKGVSYTQVHYGEYVIIDTENKNDPDNGKIFKRGTHIENEFGGAEYFAQIVGPSGNATNFHYDSYNNILTIPDEQEGKIVTKENREESLNLQTTTLVPGKYNLPPYQGGGVQYNDKLKWRTCKVRDINNKTEDFYIGFQIPYLVTDFEVSEVNPYQSEISIDRMDDQSHPFYQKWNINIPAPKKGNEIKNIRIFDWFDHRNINDVEDYSGRYDDWNEGRSPGNKCIWVGDYYDYSETIDPTPKTIYLGDYDVASHFQINQNGTITTKKTHSGQSTTQNSIVKWPANIHVDTGMTGEGDGDQKIYINWNDGTNTIIGEPINYILDTTVDDQNRLLVRYSDPNKRRDGITYGGKTGWTNVGTINTKKVDTIYSKLIKQYTIGDTFNIVRGVTGYIHLIDVDAYAERSQQCFLSFYIPYSYIRLNEEQELIIDSSKSDNKITFSIQESKYSDSVGGFAMIEIYNQNSYNFGGSIPLSRYKVDPVGGGLRFVLYLTNEENRLIQNKKHTYLGLSSNDDATYCVNGYITCRIKVAQRVLDQTGSLTNGS